MKKIISLVMSFMIILPCMSSVVFGETTLNGTGTAEDPYLITSEEDLIAFRTLAEADAAANETDKTSNLCAKITNDIQLTASWSPIMPPTSNNYKFIGTIDGDGHTISNIKQGRADVMGLVGEGGGGITFKNLTLQGEYVGVNSTGGFLGRVRGGGATFINCVNKVNISGTTSLGGFIGLDGTNKNVFEGCANYGNITATNGNASGFISTQGDYNAKYTNCANYGNISSTANETAGISNKGTFINCIGYGTVTSTGSAALPIFNGWDSNVKKTNCYYLEGIAHHESVTTTSGTKKTAAEFASGEVAYLLNGSSSEAENVKWGQKIGEDNYPVYGKVDYIVYNNGGEYANSKFDGTEESPYQISTEAGLIAFRKKVEDNAKANGNVSKLCAKLNDDITLTSPWERLGGGSLEYAGTFDGNGHTITFSKSGRADVMGFVGEGGDGLAIKNLTLEGSFKTTSNDSIYTAGFIGRANGETLIENCVNKVEISGKNTLGGFVGCTSNPVTIKNCRNYANITGTEDFVAGFIGRANLGTCVISNSANYGDITAGTQSAEKGSAYGLINRGTIENSFNAGAVIETEDGVKVAPLVADGSANNCYYDSTKTVGSEGTIGVGKTTEQFASGEVAYLINKGATEIVFTQNIGTDQAPVWGNETTNIVYKNNNTYSNTSGTFLSLNADKVVWGSKTDAAIGWVAQYNSNKELVYIKSYNVSDIGKIDLIPNSDAKKVKVFLWAKDDYRPLCINDELLLN